MIEGSWAKIWLLGSRLGAIYRAKNGGYGVKIKGSVASQFKIGVSGARIGDSRAEILVSGAMINGSGFKIGGTGVKIRG